MTFSDGTIRKVLKLLLKYKLSPEGTIVTGELIYFQLKFQPNSNRTYICWPRNVQTDIKNVLNQNKKPFKYLKRTDDEIGFFHDFELKQSFTSLVIPTNDNEPPYFEVDITNELRSWLKSFVEMEGDESKLRCTLKDDNIGHVLNSSSNPNSILISKI